MLINIPLNNNLNFTVVKKKQKYFLIIFDKYIYIKYIFSEKSSMYILSDFNYINNIIYFFNILIKKLKKTKLIFYSVNYIFFKNIINLTLKIKKFNIFTQKGLRLSRQLIYKKIGKKSS